VSIILQTLKYESRFVNICREAQWQISLAIQNHPFAEVAVTQVTKID